MTDANTAKPAAKPARAVKGHNSRAMLLDTLFDAARTVGAGTLALISAIKACGAKQEDTRETFFVGHMVGRAGFTREQSLIAFNKKWNPKGEKKGDDYQTVKEFNAMNAAKTAWARALADADVKSTGHGAGNANAKAKGAMNTDKLKVPGRPKVETDVKLAAFIAANSMVPVNLFLLNKGHKATKGALADELRRAVFDHAQCVQQIVAKYEIADEGDEGDGE